MSRAKLLPVESLEKYLAKQLPKANFSLDRPSNPKGIWFLDVSVEVHKVVIQWQDSSGFGVSCASTHGYGEGPDEFYTNIEAVKHRVLSLLLSGSQTAPPPTLRLHELRKACGVSQIELAERLSIQQGAVSRLERRSDIKISTIRDFVKSLGGVPTRLCGSGDD
ncbi:MAG: helix-turn-helix transcriptional regulator, partial [Aureliella sp.]